MNPILRSPWKPGWPAWPSAQDWWLEMIDAGIDKMYDVQDAVEILKSSVDESDRIISKMMEGGKPK